MPYGDFWPGRYGHDWDSWTLLPKSKRSQIMRETHQREREEAARLARLRSIADDLAAAGSSVALADAHDAVAELTAVALEGWTGRDSVGQRTQPAALIGPRGLMLFRQGGTITTATLPDRAAVGALRTRLEGVGFVTAQPADVAAGLLGDCDAAVPDAVHRWLKATSGAHIQHSEPYWNARPMPGPWSGERRQKSPAYGVTWEDIGFLADGRLAWHCAVGMEDPSHLSGDMRNSPPDDMRKGPPIDTER